MPPQVFDLTPVCVLLGIHQGYSMWSFLLPVQELQSNFKSWFEERLYSFKSVELVIHILVNTKTPIVIVFFIIRATFQQGTEIPLHKIARSTIFHALSTAIVNATQPPIKRWILAESLLCQGFKKAKNRDGICPRCPFTLCKSIF